WLTLARPNLLDLYPVRQMGFRDRSGDLQYAVIEGRSDLLGLDTFRQSKRTFELPVAEFAQLPVFLIDFRRSSSLPFYRYLVSNDRKIHLSGIDAWDSHPVNEIPILCIRLDFRDEGRLRR